MSNSQTAVSADATKEEKEEVQIVTATTADSKDDDSTSLHSAGGRSLRVPMTMKLLSVVLVSLIGFGSHWSSGVTGAMKSTLKKVRFVSFSSPPPPFSLTALTLGQKLHINNAEYALLDASEDFIKSALILLTGLVTDRVGGAHALLWGNALYSVGAILVAAATSVRSYRFMIGGIVVQAFGDVATQVAQYKVFSSWFAPSDGFASTLGFELGLGKIGSFVGQATANVIARRLGDFSWVYWMAVVMNVFTNVVTVGFFFFTRWCAHRFGDLADPATGERLTESNKTFELRKVRSLPWPFWAVMAFTLFETSTAIIFSSNATELAEQRFAVDSVTAGWYAALSKYTGFFLVPVLGVVIDRFGQRLSIMLVCGACMFAAMALVTWGETVSGTAASFGVYAMALSLGPTTIIDSTRTAMWYPEVFGSAYGIKIGINNGMNIIVRIVTGVIQDHDNDSYDRVVIVYAVLAAASLVVGIALVVLGRLFPDLGRLQWSRTKRMANGHVIVERRHHFETGPHARRHRLFSQSCLAAVISLLVGSWIAYFWGVATGNND